MNNYIWNYNICVKYKKNEQNLKQTDDMILKVLSCKQFQELYGLYVAKKNNWLYSKRYWKQLEKS